MDIIPNEQVNITTNGDIYRDLYALLENQENAVINPVDFGLPRYARGNNGLLKWKPSIINLYHGFH